MLSGNVQEYYVFEGMDRVAVLGPNVYTGVYTNALIESYLFDGIDHPLRIARPGATTNYYYYEIDLAGNVRGLCASGGASLGGYRYSAFGQTLEDTSLINQPLRWKGRWFSPVAGGTYDVRARQWSPELGIFLVVDEFDKHDANSTLWGWPNQNPIRFVDPTGQGMELLCQAVGAAVTLQCAFIVGSPTKLCVDLGVQAYQWCMNHPQPPAPPNQCPGN